MKLPGKTRVWYAVALLVVLVAISIPLVYLYNQNQELRKKVSGNSGSPNEVRALVDRVSKLILLPAGETPTVMTVTDKEKLSNQTFFAHAKNGDKVLIYQEAKKAFLFDPDRGIILEVGPVTFTATGSATQVADLTPTPKVQGESTASQSASARFYLLNGAVTAGLTRKYEPVLVSKIPTAVVVDRGNAVSAYSTSRLVDVSGAYSGLLETYANLLGMAIGTLPDGESKPDVDFLILLGSDIAAEL